MLARMEGEFCTRLLSVAGAQALLARRAG